MDYNRLSRWKLAQLLGGVTREFFEIETAEMIAARYADLFKLYGPEQLLEFVDVVAIANETGAHDHDDGYDPLWEQVGYVEPRKLKKAIGLYLSPRDAVDSSV